MTPNDYHQLLPKPSKLFHKEPLTDHLLLIDGISRTGKMLMGKLLSNFTGVENFLAYEPIELVAHLSHFGVMERANAEAFLRLNLDIAIYNLAVGRNLNTRLSDSSSVNWSLNAHEYHDRAAEPDSTALFANFVAENRQPLFMTHECLRYADLFFAVAPRIRIIETVRHPIDLTFSCWQRGWGDRYGIDPLWFSLTVKHKDAAVPPFAVEWADDYLQMAPIDRVIRSIATIRKLCDDAVQRLTPAQQAAVFFVPYERLLLNPDLVIHQLGTFIKSSPLPGFEILFERERLTTTSLQVAVEQRFEKIRKQADPESLNVLEFESDLYVARHKADPFA